MLIEKPAVVHSQQKGNKKMRIGPLTSYVWGFIVSALAFVIILTKLDELSQESTNINMCVAGLIGIGILLSGLRIGEDQQVPINHEAVLTFIGMRLPIILTEGWVWILYGLMDFISFDVREKSLKIGDDGQLKIIAVDPDTGRTAEMTAKLVFRFKITNVLKFIKIGWETLNDNLVEYSKSSLREYGGSVDFRKLISEKDNIGSQIEKAFQEEMGDVMESWGVEFLGLSLSKVVPSDPALVRAMEKKAVEEEEGDGYLTEIKRNVEQVRYYAQQIKEMNDAGLDTATASEMILTMQGKSNMSFVKGFQGTNVMPTFPVNAEKAKPTTEGGAQ